MLLKPATPLTVLLLITFVLLLLSVLSTPIIKTIPLARFKDVDFGVFGWCENAQCSGIHVGYDTNDLFRNNGNGSEVFDLPAGARNSLSTILIVHPVAAFLTLVCLAMAAAAHFHAPSHSPRYLLVLLILLLPTLLVSLLAFLVDILLFVPRLQWGGWIVLVATVLLVSCGVVTCAMRRTLVSRKARKRRIAENAERSDPFYHRSHDAAIPTAAGPIFAEAESPPPLSIEQKTPLINSTAILASAPTFATFDSSTQGPPDHDLARVYSRSHSHPSPDDVPSRYDSSAGRGDARGYNGPRDEYGNPLPPSGPYPSDRPIMRTPSDGGVPGFVGPRGRGGYPGRSMYGYGRGGPHGRGPIPNGRGSMRGRGQRGPPPGYPQRRDGGYDAYALGPGRRSEPPLPPPPPIPPLPPSRLPGYGFNQPGDYGSKSLPMRPGAIGPPEREVPIGRAIDLPHLQPLPDDRYGQDPEVVGVDLQQQRDESGSVEQGRVSIYGTEGPYLPPRAGWSQSAANPLHREEPHRDVSPPSPSSPRKSRDEYVEDVDPRFAEPSWPASAGMTAVPSALQPGPPGEIQPSTSEETLPDELRSPAASDTSHFTSISERSVNPLWHPPPPPPSRSLQRLRQQQRQDLLLTSNPDFELQPGHGQGIRARLKMVPEHVAGSGGRYPTSS
ncbi:hypothetical protein Egran_05906 [Elaphomyces granulatus]|uniref:PH-response regulator protein palI/RIM9 n=1 Tax=Elaphomyces granulatus TaxID=519963 RepID=A0A232LQ92_9EURO|nr:hypothetical protein Egran_05906 [Elaphomyces granulatus]